MSVYQENSRKRLVKNFFSLFGCHKERTALPVPIFWLLFMLLLWKLLLIVAICDEACFAFIWMLAASDVSFNHIYSSS